MNGQYQTQDDNQPQIRTSPYLSPMYNYGSSIITLTNPQNELHKMELTFRSMVTDRSGNPHPVGQPLMNDLGISSVIGQVQAIVSQVTIMSNLDKRDIPILITSLGDALALDLMVSWKKYGIDETTKNSVRTKVYFTALHTAYICMKRAFEEGDRRFWKGSQQDIRTEVVGGTASRGGGLLSRVLGWGKK